MRGIVRATKPYARASKIYKYSYLMKNSQTFDFLKAQHKIGAKKCSSIFTTDCWWWKLNWHQLKLWWYFDCLWPIVQYWLLLVVVVVEILVLPPTSSYIFLTLLIGTRRCRSIMHIVYNSWIFRSISYCWLLTMSFELPMFPPLPIYWNLPYIGMWDLRGH